MNILLADDDPKIHLVVKLWLTRRGHRLTSAPNGQEALKLLSQQSYDLLISDVNMPLMTGTELVAAALKLANPPGLVIMLTSRCDLSKLREQPDLEGVHFFNKPFSPQALMELIDQLGTQAATPAGDPADE